MAVLRCNQPPILVRAVHTPPCSVGVGWKLPGGRSAEEHHLFPSLHGPAPAGALQEPIYVSSGAWVGAVSPSKVNPNVSA